MRDERQFFRRLSILQRIPLQGRGKISTEKLSAHLGNLGYQTTIRTVERDLLWLSRYFPINSDQGRPQGWFWTAGSAGLQVPHMDALTALALLLSHRVLGPLLPSGLLENWENYRLAAEAALKGTQLADWQRRVIVLPNTLQRPPEILPTRLLRLLEAMEEKRRVRMLYQRPGNAGREHFVSPWGLVLHDGSLYCIGALSDGRPLLFAVHRMQALELPEEAALPLPEGFSLESFARESLRFGMEGQHLRLRLQIDRDLAHLLEERPLGQHQQILQRGRRWVTVETEVEHSSALVWWILSLGANVRVLAPGHFRAQIRDTIQEMAALYVRMPRDVKKEPHCGQ